MTTRVGKHTYKEKEVIVCAANKSEYRIILGIRHWDTLMCLAADDYDPEIIEWEQGFITNKGRFLTRREAWVLAKEAGQIPQDYEGYEEGYLYSEDLY